MYPRRATRRPPRHRFPRASGGVSPPALRPRAFSEFSPCERGCVLAEGPCAGIPHVFPVRAGGCPVEVQDSVHVAGFPRASGGVSVVVPMTAWHCMFSPCERGVSRDQGCLRWPELFSPCERGCVLHVNVGFGSGIVFPVRAGVCPEVSWARRQWSCFPRASGGVSGSDQILCSAAGFSPCERGCVSQCGCDQGARLVFPVRAGVCRHKSGAAEDSNGVPRASGGAPTTFVLDVVQRIFSPSLRGGVSSGELAELQRRSCSLLEQGCTLPWQALPPPVFVFPAHAASRQACGAQTNQPTARVRRLAFRIARKFTDVMLMAGLTDRWRRS